MPETRRHHVLNRPLLPVRELNRSLLYAFARALAAFLANSWIAFTRSLAAYAARLRRSLLTLARTAPAFRTRLRFERLAIPFRIAEVLMRLHKIVNRKVVFPIIKPRAASDDLLEFDY